MHPELEQLIEMALADGQVTDKERQIILNKAEILGANLDEIELIVNGKISLQKKNHANLHKKEKAGKLVVCPSCGSQTESFQLYCANCGHEYRNGLKNESLNALFISLNELSNNFSLDELKDKKIELIRNYIVPNSKDDIIEFATKSIAEINVSDFKSDLNDAWVSKAEEALNKFVIFCQNNDALLKTHSLLELKLTEKIKKINSKKKNENWIVFGSVSFP